MVSEGFKFVLVFVTFGVRSFVEGRQIPNANLTSNSNQTDVVRVESSAINDKPADDTRTLFSWDAVLKCTLALDANCLITEFQDALIDARSRFLRQAEAEALKMTARADQEGSKVSQYVGHFLLEITRMTKQYYREGRKVEIGLGKDDTSLAATSRDTKGKDKKIKKMVNSVKMFGLALIFYLLVSLVISIITLKLKIKFFLLAIGITVAKALSVVIPFLFRKLPSPLPTKQIHYPHNDHQQHLYSYGNEHELLERTYSTPQDIAYSHYINNKDKQT